VAQVDERAIIIKKFKATGHEKISEFVRAVGSELSQETWGAIINRGDKPNLRTLLKMCADLNCTSEELKQILISKGESQIAKWISPNQVTPEEQKLLDKVRAIKDPKKLKLITDMLDNL
jgi:hypothetical protein